jgi:hypothetical protein
MLLLLEGASLAMSDAVIIGVLTIAAGCLTSYLTSKSAAAEWKGAANQKFENIETKFSEIDQDSNNQWREIRKVSNATAKLDGEFSHFRSKPR